MTAFASMNNISGRENSENPPGWTRGLSQEDINSMHRVYFDHRFIAFLLNLLSCFLFRAGRIISGGLGSRNQETLWPGIPAGHWRGTRNDQREISEYFLAECTEEMNGNRKPFVYYSFKFILMCSRRLSAKCRSTYQYVVISFYN